VDAKGHAIEASLRLLEGLHERWVVLLRSLSEEDVRRRFRHPELGVVTVDQYIALYAWHGKHHVAHVMGLRERMGW
jgi:hypothetical protein